MERIQKMYFAKFHLKDFKKCEFEDSMTNLRKFDCDVSLATLGSSTGSTDDNEIESRLFAFF